MTKAQIIAKIKEGLTKHKFASWYNERGTFDSWIRGEILQDGSKVTDEQIEKDIEKLFNL